MIFGELYVFAPVSEKWLHLTWKCSLLLSYFLAEPCLNLMTVLPPLCTSLKIRAEIVSILKRRCTRSNLLCHPNKPLKSGKGQPVVLYLSRCHLNCVVSKVMGAEKKVVWEVLACTCQEVTTTLLTVHWPGVPIWLQSKCKEIQWVPNHQ